MKKIIFKKAPFVLEKNIDNKIYLLNPQKGDLYVLNKVGKFIWRLINGKNSLEDIKNKILKKFNVKEKVLSYSLNRFLNNLERLKIIERKEQYED